MRLLKDEGKAGGRLYKAGGLATCVTVALKRGEGQGNFALSPQVHALTCSSESVSPASSINA
jgi:hypothetical protein